MKKAIFMLLMISIIGTSVAFAHFGYNGIQNGQHTYNEEMRETLEKGNYSDLEEMREETELPMMRGIQNEQDFNHVKERHQMIEERRNEFPQERGMHRNSFGRGNMHNNYHPCFG